VIFGIFGVTKDANKAHSYLVNFLDYALGSVGLHGFERGALLVASSEWAAGPSAREERGAKFLHFRLCVPFSSFFCTVDNDTNLNGAPSENTRVTIEASDEFSGFGLYAYSEGPRIQVWAMNGIEKRATARACMLMARFKSKGATDITSALRGVY
jgi:hypothetical protein